MYDHEPSNGPLLNSVTRTISRLDIGRTKVYELIKDGQLEVVKVGGKTLITENSIRTFIAGLSRGLNTDNAPREAA